MDDSTLIIVIVLGAALWAVICYFGYRFIFSIKRQLWNQKQMIKLLMLIAEKQGVNKEVLNDIEQMSNADDQFLK